MKENIQCNRHQDWYDFFVLKNPKEVRNRRGTFLT